MTNHCENIAVLVGILLVCICGNAQQCFDYHLARCATTANTAAYCWHEGDFLFASFLNKYGTREMMTETVDYHHVHQQNCLYASLMHSGFSRFGELEATVGYGRTFGQRLSVSMQACYLLSHADGYPSVHSFTVDLSACCRITDRCALAVQVNNPLHLHYGITGGEVIPMLFDLRLIYHSNRQSGGWLFVSKTLPGELDIGAGGLWQPHPHLMLQAAVSNTHLLAGVHIPFRNFIATIHCQWHYHSGFSPQCQLSCKL